MPERRPLTPKEIEQLQQQDEESSARTPLAGRVRSRLRVTPKAGEGRTHLNPTSAARPKAEPPVEHETRAATRPIAASPAPAIPVPPQKEVKSARSAENKAAMAEIRRLEAIGKAEAAAAIAEERGWVEIARNVVKRALRPRRKEPLRAAPIPVEQPSPPAPVAPRKASPAAKSTIARKTAAPVKKAAPPTKKPPAARKPTADEALALLRSALENEPEAPIASRRRKPTRVINVPDSVRDRYSLPPAAHPEERS